MQRFFVEPSNISNGKIAFSREQVHQICDVLRLKVGDHIIILDNAGSQYAVALTEVTGRQVVGEVVDKQPATGEPGVHLTLFQSMLSREKFELVLQKCTEVGVCEFVPIITQRSIVREGAAAVPAKLARWRKIITEAAEQSGRGQIPELREPVKFEQAVSQNQISNIKYQNCGMSYSDEDAREFDCRLIASTSSAGRSLRDVIRPGCRTVALFVGPEGGFSEQELRSARECGIIEISLGKRILRTETAAVVASALILYELGEMEPRPVARIS